MTRLAERPDFEHLKKQAKDLLRRYDAHDPAAFARFRQQLPVAAGRDDDAIAALKLKLHDAQSCIAREYGLPSWTNLKNYVDLRDNKLFQSRSTGVPAWLNLVYGHDGDRPQPTLAAKLLEEHPDFGRGELLLSCASGDDVAVRQAIADDPTCVSRMSAPWRCPCCNESRVMPPLVAATHSSLLRLPAFCDRLRQCTRLLLEAGADPNQAQTTPHGPLSALYGAAGTNHDPDLTALLLSAGANPNDNESLYHAMETSNLACATLLLDAGARVEGTNALHHQLDTDHIEGLRLLLSHTRDVNDRASPLGNPLLWAIRRGRSLMHIELLLQAGADVHARPHDGTGPYRLALQYGLVEVAEALRHAGASDPITVHDHFVTACARGDRAEATRVLAERPTIVRELSESQLRQLPNLTEARKGDAVRLMVDLGWPIAVRGGDWDASALNIAVFQGDAALTRFLLEHGATWTERHGHGDNVHGTLAWSSRNHDPDEGDWPGCARALIEHGLPVLEIDGDYSDDVAEVLRAERERLTDR